MVFEVLTGYILEVRHDLLTSSGGFGYHCRACRLELELQVFIIT
jgi:hypothetical protein